MAVLYCEALYHFLHRLLKIDSILFILILYNVSGLGFHLFVYLTVYLLHSLLKNGLRDASRANTDVLRRDPFVFLVKTHVIITTTIIALVVIIIICLKGRLMRFTSTSSGTQHPNGARSTDEAPACLQLSFLYCSANGCALDLTSTPATEGFIKVQECKSYVPHSQQGFVTRPCYDKKQLHGLCSSNVGSIPNLLRR